MEKNYLFKGEIKSPALDGFRVIPVSQPFHYTNNQKVERVDWDKKYTPDWFKIPVVEIIVEN